MITLWAQRVMVRFKGKRGVRPMIFWMVTPPLTWTG